MLQSSNMWTRCTDRSDSKFGVETLHLQTRLFGGVDVVRRKAKRGGRPVDKSIESFDCRDQAERYIGKLVSEGHFRPIGEAV